MLSGFELYPRWVPLLRTLNYSRLQQTHVEFGPQTTSSEVYLVLKSKRGIMSQKSYFLFNKSPRLHYWDVLMAIIFFRSFLTWPPSS